MMSLTLIATSELQHDTSRLITQRAAIPSYEVRRALEKERDNCTGTIKAEAESAVAGLGYATALKGWQRWYPL